MSWTTTVTAAPILIFLVLWGAMSAAPGRAEAAFSVQPVEYVLTTDILMLSRGDLQVEFSSILTRRSAWAIRIGYFKHIRATSQPYADGRGRWEVGFRWRFFLLQHAPHWLFIGLGWDNRPQDGEAAPLGEAGFALHYKPLTVMTLGYYGYKFYFKTTPGFENKAFGGFEARVGLCF